MWFQLCVKVVCTTVLVLSSAVVCLAAKETCQESQICVDASGNQGYCLIGVCMTQIPEYDRQNLTFQIVVQYPEKTVDPGTLFIRGNGLGFNWRTGVPLTKTAPDTWQIDVTFKSGKYGFVCQSCQDQSALKVGQDFQYRLLIDDRIDMQGGDFSVDLPVSKSALHNTTRQIVVQPWFFQKTGTVTNFTLASSNIGSERKLSLYAPPSFLENPYKNYGVLIIFDLDQSLMEFLRAAMFDEFATRGLAEETFILGWGDYKMSERVRLLTPSVGYTFMCLNGTWSNQCDGCYPLEYEINSPDWLEVMRDRCGYPATMGGNGEATLDFLTREVLPKIDELSSNRTLKDRQKTGILGFSLGGLMSCHAMWTRPEIFGYAACQSASLWWPMLPDASTTFEFFNVTLKNPEYQKNRKPQRVFNDVGDGYNEISQPWAGTSAEETVELLASTGYFKLDDNLFFQLQRTHTHSTENWLKRMWSPLSLLIPPPAPPTDISSAAAAAN